LDQFGDIVLIKSIAEKEEEDLQVGPYKTFEILIKLAFSLS
jgi:hypothetical protein